MTAKILCYGGICVDNIIHVPYMPSPGIAATPTHQQFRLGGGATLTAVWIANWGIPVLLSGNAIGDDAYGRDILEQLNTYPELDTSQIQQLPDVDTPYTRAIVPPNGDRYLIEVGYDRAPMCPADKIDLDDVALLTVNFYYNNPEVESQQLAQTAYHQGITVVASDVLEEDNGFFDVSDILINSRAVLAKKFATVDPYEHMVALQAKHGGVVIMTDGEKPVWVVDRDGKTFRVDVPEVKAYNTTGAGDAFRAGLVYGQLQGWTLEESVKLGVASGTLQVQGDLSNLPDTSLENCQKLARTLKVTR